MKIQMTLTYLLSDDDASPITVTDDDAFPITVTVELPAHYEVCDRCHGNGTHDHPAFSDGFTHDELYGDPDFAEAYFAGAYDVRCEECNGLRVRIEVDRDQLTPEELVQVEAHEQYLADKAADAREAAHTRRMESGGY